MGNAKHRRLAAAGAIAVSALTALAGCGGGSQKNADSAGAGAKGGTLYLVNSSAMTHLDPQRIYPNRTMAFSSRTFIRTLTTFAPGTADLVADAATDTGKASDGAKTWTFTLRDGVKWQDGKAVTCEDFKYGISRTFATDTITAGPLFAIAYLDIPSKPDGSSQYEGPYKKTGQELYDKAVQCTDAKTIVFHTKHPVADLNNVLALPGYGAVRQDKDTGAKFDFTLFSDGPYMLEGTWNPQTGGTLVRNPNWDPSTDSVRKALPDKIVVEQGVNAQTVSQRMVSDGGNDKYAYTNTRLDPSVIPQVLSNPALKKRSVNDVGGFVDYLSVNVKHIPDLKVRQALALATDKTTYRVAMGGDTYGEYATTIMSKTIAGWKNFNVLKAPPEGDLARAKALLQEAGAPQPYPITYGYQQSPVQDKVAAALQASWEKAGFKVTLKPMGDNYYDVLANPTQNPDVAWVSWVADWPSGSTDIPALFDSRVNISKNNLGNDFSELADPELNANIDKAWAIADKAEQDKAWGDLDEQVVKTGAVIPLVYQKYFYMQGSGVKGMKHFFGGFPDIAEVSVR
ncbi:ABC transporter substrate-binding protein [Planosporangium mesophilum]|uniref:ABC transporter substrate-binding protein n=1 Tax=Planosporangium mesophilum TaxID=689768 RepID=UPI00143A6932|nr:ABC transporter substrate-binding protein [Planosporangium mesophilum]NJC83558.1 ABC transporter substrate-binding protein [Planosporangium mesophilum]